MNTEAVAREVALAAIPDGALLDRGLAIAARTRGLTFVAFPAEVAPASALIDAWRGATIASWSAPDGTVVVGIGAARELRGRGAERFDEVASAARAIALGGAAIDGRPAPLAALGFARPRFLGGAAFAPGAADAAPWTGFGDAWFVLPRWTYTHDGHRAQLVLAIDGANVVDAARWRAELARHRTALATRFALHAQPALRELAVADAETWRDQVDAITGAIARGWCSKIVAARTCTVELAEPTRVADLMAALDARHAECVRVLIAPPGAGHLVAATPERLVRRVGAVVECDALAGTIATSAADGDATLRASDKDRREHAIVVSAIANALAAADVQVAIGETGVRALRHVLHLHAAIRGTLARPRHVLELVARLHPTPAVGGTPTDVALDWIAAREPVPRGWYAAPVGWFDLDGDGEFAVALRSGVVVGVRAHLWAGAGIVAGSDPDRELAETDAKLRAMLGALGVVG